MAQKDIEAIAEAMRAEEADRAACDEAYAKAQEEEQAFIDEEFEQIEDEIIDPASMGFVDSEVAGESDAFYNEDDYSERLKEDVSDCIEKEPVEEAEENGSIEVDVYNEDGFGEHFASEVMKNVPGVVAKTKKTTRPNGDIIVRIEGSRPDLERAFAFYVGEKSFAVLSQEDKNEFESLLVFNDGDTVAEAKLREDVATMLNVDDLSHAHNTDGPTPIEKALDIVGVKASTADLSDQDTCAFSIIKEEKARRTAKKFLKALQENDLEQLTDKELDQLDGIQDALQSGEGQEGMTPEEKRVWEVLLNQMGYTQEEWDKLTPEEQDKVWKADLSMHDQANKTGFANYTIERDPKTGKLKKYYPRGVTVGNYDEEGNYMGYQIDVPFNPSYAGKETRDQIDKERKQAEIDAEDKMMKDRVLAAAKNASGKDTWTLYDWYQMISPLTGDMRKKLMKELIDEIQSTTADKAEAAKQIAVVKQMFGRKLTLRDIGAMWDKGHPAVLKFMSDFDIAVAQAIKKTTGDADNSPEAFKKLVMNDAQFPKFIKLLTQELNAKKTGRNPTDPERAAHREEWLKMVRELGYSPKTWDALPVEKQLELTDKYYASHN